MTQKLWKEPSISEMMEEPIIRAVMARDAVEEVDLRCLLDRVSVQYRAGKELVLAD